MPAAQCSLCGLFGSSCTRDEELLNGHHHLTERKHQYLTFGVSLDPTHRAAFLSLLCRRAMKECALTLTFLEPHKECKQVFVACFEM